MTTHLDDRSRSPVVIGQSAAAIDTPALLVDAPTFQANVARIADACRAAGVRWRPHTKGLRSPDLVRRLLSAGAQGVTVAKLDEAWAMAQAGIDDILIANQVVGPIKIGRLIRLAQQTSVTVAVDDLGNVHELAAAAAEAGLRLPVLIEVDLGLSRAGTAPGQATVALARQIAGCESLRFDGLMAWEGHVTRISDRDDRRAAVEAALRELTATADACRAAGLDVPIVSAGGTATFATAVKVPGITEIQAGGGVLSDLRASAKLGVDLPIALHVSSTVTSRPTPTRIVCDAGRRSMSDDYATPEPIGVGQWLSVGLSAEHATIELAQPSLAPRVGDRLSFRAGYGDTTVHLHEALILVDGGRVIDIWPILARGSR